MQKITTFLWFDNQAEEAAAFYTSIFENSEITEVRRYGPAGLGPEGNAMLVVFHLDGHEFIALNGGPQHKFTEAISLYVNCEDQAEVDDLWDRLIADGGQPSRCGWLKDKFGVSWQVVPRVLGELMGDPNPEKAGRVTEAMLRMQKIDIQTLKDTYNKQ